MEDKTNSDELEVSLRDCKELVQLLNRSAISFKYGEGVKVRIHELWAKLRIGNE